MRWSSCSISTTAGRDGVEVEFLGTPHLLRFEEALPYIECADPNETIRRNTRAYNAALERFILQHPEQWFWAHRR
jgi:hypothetical protein